MFQNPDNPSVVDRIFTDFHRIFQKLCAVETEFHTITLTVLKRYFRKRILKDLVIKTIKTIQMIFFGNLYLMKLLQVCNEIPAPETYLNVCVKVLDKCAPKKSKYVRANNCPIRIKKIPKAKMDCTRVRLQKNKNLENLIS